MPTGGKWFELFSILHKRINGSDPGIQCESHSLPHPDRPGFRRMQMLQVPKFDDTGQKPEQKPDRAISGYGLAVQDPKPFEGTRHFVVFQLEP